MVTQEKFYVPRLQKTEDEMKEEMKTGRVLLIAKIRRAALVMVNICQYQFFPVCFLKPSQMAGSCPSTVEGPRKRNWNFRFLRMKFETNINIVPFLTPTVWTCKLMVGRCFFLLGPGFPWHVLSLFVSESVHGHNLAGLWRGGICRRQDGQDDRSCCLDYLLDMNETQQSCSYHIHTDFTIYHDFIVPLYT